MISGVGYGSRQVLAPRFKRYCCFLQIMIPRENDFYFILFSLFINLDNYTTLYVFVKNNTPMSVFFTLQMKTAYWFSNFPVLILFPRAYSLLIMYPKLD